MSAATPHRDEVRELLAEMYPGASALGLLPLCGPRCEIHFEKRCEHPGKVPTSRGWTADARERWADPDADAETWRARIADHLSRGGNTGWCPPDRGLVLDADTPASVAYLERALPDAPAQDTARGAHYVVRLPEGVELPARIGVEIAPGVRVDLRPGLKAQVAVEPSEHASGSHYCWRRPLPAEPGELPEIPPGLLAGLLDALGAEPKRRERGNGSGEIPKGSRNDTLHRIAAAMRGRGEPPDAILAELRRVNAEQCRPPLADGELQQIARSAERYAAGSPAPASDCEDVANAERLARHYAEAMRWCAARGWLVWTGTVWEESETRALALAARLGRIVQREAADVAREAAACGDDAKRERLAKQAEALLKWAKASEQAKRIRAALDLARPALEVSDEALDSDPWALGCRNGVVDLRTGALRPHRPADYLTRCTGIDFDPEARSELWERVLAEALPDSPVREYLARCAGYTACGVTGEDVLLLVHGPTRTSKGTIQGAIAAALGGYAMTAGLETFAARKHADGSRARPELIRLRGARMVSVYETGRALRLDAELVKTLAGSDRITARALYREETEFVPACTLWIATNHRPRVDDDDAALWERMRELPFSVHVPPERRDPKVRASLADPAGPDARAVLAWIVRGARAWQRERLGHPEAVKDATKAYRDAMDPLGEYVAECLVLDPRAWVASGLLREDYERWCRERGEKPIAAKQWGESLRRHGATPEKVGDRRGWDGVGLRAGVSE